MSLSFKPRLYLRPKDIGEVSSLLRQHGERAKIIAGGTGIYEVAHRGLLSEIETLIDISDLNLSYVKLEEHHLRIGACTTMSSLGQAREIVANHEIMALADALKAIQPLQVKNVATIAGAVCTALPFFDLPVVLQALDASVVIAPSNSTKKISEFMRGYFSVGLEPGEFVKEILIHASSDGRAASAFSKFALTGDDWAIINCGVHVALNDSDRISKATIVYGGGVGEKPVIAKSISSSLTGLDPKDEQAIERAVEENISSDLEPIADIRASAGYRMQLAKVLGRRTVLQASSRASR